MPRIIGGVDAKPGEFPHQVSLMLSSKVSDSPGVDRHFCGGSIVGDEWVATAAHCVADMTGMQGLYSVGSGSIDLNKLEEYELDGIWVHPNYDAGTLDYDFALIKVRTPFFDPEIAIADKADNQHINVGSAATITGWGVDASGNIQQILKKADVEVVSRVDCNDADSYNGTVTSRMICLGLEKGGKDTCQGDSGGPALARVEGGARVLFAVTSWGEGCAEAEKFGVYARLIAVKGWIDSVLAQNVRTSGLQR
jgi:secreted trypsin-like serine protease